MWLISSRSIINSHRIRRVLVLTAFITAFLPIVTRAQSLKINQDDGLTSFPLPTQMNRIFLRITNSSQGLKSIFLRLQFTRPSASRSDRREFVEAGYIGRKGLVQAGNIYKGKSGIAAQLDFNLFHPSGILTTDYLNPGEESPWIDLSPFLALKTSNTVRITALTAEGKKASIFSGIISFSAEPNDSKVLRSFNFAIDSSCQVFEVPEEISEAVPIRSAQELIDGPLRELEMLGTLPGKRPEKFVFAAPLKLFDEMPVSWWQSLWRTFAALGLNTATVPLNARAQIGAETFDSMARQEGVLSYDFYRDMLPNVVTGFDTSKTDELTRSRVDSEIKSAEAIGSLAPYSIFKYKDEPCIYRWAPWFNHILPDSLLVTRLRGMGFVPGDLGVKSWEELKVPSLAQYDTANPKVWYESTTALRDAMTDLLSVGNQTVKERFPKKIKTAVTLSATFIPGEAKGNMMLSASDFWDIASKATDVLTTDYYPALGSGISLESMSYINDLLRSACRAKQIPFGAYIQTNCSPEALRLMVYSAISHGATYIYYWCYGPKYETGEMSFSNNGPVLAEIAKINFEAGGFEDLLFKSKRRKADTAILFSKSSSVWEKCPPDNSIDQEMICDYLALVHQQIPVDLLSEEDVLSGQLKDYKCLYLVGPNLKRPTSSVIANWVRDGGVLWGCAGAGSRDEFNEEDITLDPIFGLKNRQFQIAKSGYVIAPKMNLKNYPVLDTISVNAPNYPGKLPMPRKLDVLCREEKMDPAGSTVIASYRNNSPAAVIHDYGRGKAVLWGGMPGLAYAKEAILDAHSTQLQGKMLVFPTPERNLIDSGALELGNVERPVEVDVPQVEASLYELPGHKIIFLNNFTGASIAQLGFRFKVNGKIKSIVSMKSGKLVYQSDAQGYVDCRVPLKINDVILVEFAPSI